MLQRDNEIEKLTKQCAELLVTCNSSQPASETADQIQHPVAGTSQGKYYNYLPSHIYIYILPIAAIKRTASGELKLRASTRLNPDGTHPSISISHQPLYTTNDIYFRIGEKIPVGSYSLQPRKRVR